MVSYLWMGIAGGLGILCYLLIPLTANMLNVRLQNKIVQQYYALAARSLGQITIVRRTVGGYSVKEMKIDDEKAAAKVVLDDNVLGDKKELHFDDPDNRMHRWKNKAVTIIHEDVPGVIDPQLAELGMHWREHYSNGKHRTDDDEINPHFEVDDKTRLVNIDDVLPLIINGSQPTDVGTMEDFTEKRFEKYHDSVGAVEVLTTFTGFGFGLGGVIVASYVRDNLLDGTSDPSTSAPINPPEVVGWLDPTLLTDSLVLLL